MLITYCRNEHGEERLYLTPHGSLEAWLEPVGTGWVCTCARGDADATPDFEAQKAEPTRRFLLTRLAERAGVAEDQLASIPFAALVKLATPMPAPSRRRMSRSRARSPERGWVIVDPIAHTPT